MPDAIAAVAARLAERAVTVPPAHRTFVETYRRTTLAVGQAVADARFEDPAWVEAWDVAFAELYLAPLDASVTGRTADVPRPWRLAFGATAGLPPLRRLLVGMNAHINYDLPQALIAVISVENFDDEVLMARRRRDHQRVDEILGARVSAEDRELGSGGRSLLDRALTPLNRLSSRRFLRESRDKVWHNAYQLDQARRLGPDAYRRRLGELEVLSAARVADLLAPGQVLLRLAVAGFGVTLPDL